MQYKHRMKNKMGLIFENSYFFSSSFAAAHPEYGEDEYVRENLAVLHVYFEALQFMRKERSELYGITDFFSNIGGLGGGCLSTCHGIR